MVSFAVTLAMLATWIETAAKGRLGGPVRAGMWSVVVIGSNPVQANQRAWLELAADDLQLGLLPAYWIENKAGNSFWHAPVPPQGSERGSITAPSSSKRGASGDRAFTRIRSSVPTCRTSPKPPNRRFPTRRAWSGTAT